MGFFFKPIMGTPIYKRVMMFMVSLAVGTLSGSALMILIPEVRICIHRRVSVYVCSVCECTSNCAYRHVSTELARPWLNWSWASGPFTTYARSRLQPTSAVGHTFEIIWMRGLNRAWGVWAVSEVRIGPQLGSSQQSQLAPLWILWRHVDLTFCAVYQNAHVCA